MVYRMNHFCWGLVSFILACVSMILFSFRVTCKHTFIAYRKMVFLFSSLTTVFVRFFKKSCFSVFLPMNTLQVVRGILRRHPSLSLVKISIFRTLRATQHCIWLLSWINQSAPSCCWGEEQSTICVSDWCNAVWYTRIDMI